MKLKLIRKYKTEKSTIGSLFIDGVFECYTLEDKVREVPGKPVSEWKVYGKTAIPVGSYKVTLSHSPRFKRILPAVLDVPGFEGIRIHPGNKAEDTEGCILVGKSHITDAVLESRAAFASLFAKLEAAGNNVTIEIV